MPIIQLTREFHDIHREEVLGDALYKRYEDEEAKQSRKRREGGILYDAQKILKVGQGQMMTNHTGEMRTMKIHHKKRPRNPERGKRPFCMMLKR